MPPGGPIPHNLARALMPRQPKSVAVLSTGGRLHPLPFWKGRGLGSGLRDSPKVAEWVKRMKAYKAVQLQDMAKRGVEVCEIAM